MGCSVEFYISLPMYFFEIWMVSLLFDPIERGFKADLIELRHVPNAVPSVTLNIER